VFTVDDIREFVFPLYIADDPSRLQPDQPIVLSNTNYLGTGFFISKNGVALTAGHVIPSPDQIPDGKALLAVVYDGELPRGQQVQIAFVHDKFDIAVLKVAFSPKKYLPVSFEPAHMGEDVMAIGIPEHSVSGPHKEFRCMKGHVTFAPTLLELSFPAPRGMSGSPVFRGSKVVGVLCGNARSEVMEDQIDEQTETVGNLVKVTRVETKAVINYGLAEPLARLRDQEFVICEGLPFNQFLAKLNGGS
jgi:hypothetical protein